MQSIAECVRSKRQIEEVKTKKSGEETLAVRCAYATASMSRQIYS